MRVYLKNWKQIEIKDFPKNHTYSLSVPFQVNDFNNDKTNTTNDWYLVIEIDNIESSEINFELETPLFKRLKSSLTEFFQELLNDEDLEELIKKFKYKTFLNNRRDKRFAHDLINSFFPWKETKKGFAHWDEIWKRLSNMKVKKEFEFNP